MGLDVFSFGDVALHKTNKDCWLIIHGKVYDVSKFMEEHPGGEYALLNVTGKDATMDFEDIGHSSYAEGLMKDFCIGEIDELTLPKITVGTNVYSTMKSSFSSTFLLSLLPLFIAGLAFLLRLYTQDE